MRTYPNNSPQAAVRIVALAMLADGEVGQPELDRLEQLGARAQLGLHAEGLQAVARACREDLLSPAHLTWADAGQVDARTLAEVMAEIDDPDLRRKVLRLCVAVVEADGHVAEGESFVLVAAVEHWGLHREMLRSDTI